MKILILNNFNYLRGGAESVFFAEKDLMTKMGNRFAEFSVNHPNNLPSVYDRHFPSEIFTDRLTYDIKGLNTLLTIFYSIESKKCLEKMLGSIAINIAHAHNIYGRLTTSILDCLRKKGIPVVLTLHDYKIICPNYKMMHHGKICEDCYQHSYYRAILNRCHKDSLIASTIYAFETYFNFIFKKYAKNIAYFISPSLFLKSKMVEFGWPAQKIEYIPQFYIQ